MFIDDVVPNWHNATYTNANTNVPETTKLVNFNGSNYVTRKIEHTKVKTNSVTRHDHNNYEHNAIKK